MLLYGPIEFGCILVQKKCTEQSVEALHGEKYHQSSVGGACTAAQPRHYSYRCESLCLDLLSRFSYLVCMAVSKISKETISFSMDSDVRTKMRLIWSNSQKGVLRNGVLVSYRQCIYLLIPSYNVGR